MLLSGMTTARLAWDWSCFWKSTRESDAALNNPEWFTLVPRSPTICRVLTRRFPYRMFFIVRADAIVVFAILHAGRHDRIWQHRAERES